MIKTEIKEVFVNIGETKDVRAILPFSIASLIEDEAIPESCAALDRASFCAYTSVDTLPGADEYVFLRFHALGAGYEVRFNGVGIESIENYREQVTYDITSSVREGVNTIELCVSTDSMLDAGVFDNIEIIKTSYAVIDNVCVTQEHSEDSVTLNIKLAALGAADNVRAVATLVSGAGQIYYGGITRGNGSITVTSPLYWWPMGLGVQNLYRLTVNIYGDMEVEDSYEVRIGLRTLKAARGKDSSLFEVNNVSFVPMGMVYNTPKNRYVKETEELVEADLAAAAKAGLNTLIIPCGSDMPREYFFELCDLYGIVAVRECCDVARDANSLLRASKYASVGIIDLIGSSGSLEEDAEKLHAIHSEFEVRIEDGEAKYPSFKSLACYKTICNRLWQSERNVFSARVEGAAEGDMMRIISGCSERFLYASNIYDISYVSQLTEAYRAESAVMYARIFRDIEGRAVFSSLGKKRDVVGDGLIDCDKRSKAVAYRAAKFFAPTVAYAFVDGCNAKFFISNESRTLFIGSLLIKIINSKNELIHVEETECSCDGSSSKLICTRDLSGYAAGHEHEYYLEYELKNGANAVSRNTALFVPEKRFVYENPNIQADIIGADRKFSITLSAEAFAQGVEIDFIGHNVIFYDNYIDITTNMPTKLSFAVVGAVTTAEKLKSELRIKSVYDIGKTYI